MISRRSGDGEVGGCARGAEKMFEEVLVGGDRGAEGEGERIVQREGM